MNHVSLDLETLGSKTKNARILQIAAVRFDPNDIDKEGAFNVYVDDPGGDVDTSTVSWWLGQGPQAVGRLSSGLAKPLSLEVALTALAVWFDKGPEAKEVWAKGSQFDIGILEHKYGLMGWGLPWGYRAPRDLRTMLALTPGEVGVPEDPDLVAHDALSDCIYQARQAQAALAYFGKK